MSIALPPVLLRIKYEEAAEAYLRSLPLEHFMEATAQATQRKITVESLDLVQARRPDFQVFNELLVQYPHGKKGDIHQVVPDNMVVLCDQPIDANGSYNVPLQPVLPFWVLEYVSKSNKRKDYEDSFHKYERELKVPFFLLFYPDGPDLTLYRHNGKKYVSVIANDNGRHPLPKVEMEIAILDGWVRYWYQGKLLPLPADLQRDLDETRQELKKARLQIKRMEEQARQAQEQADQELQKKERLLAKLRDLGIDPND
jgi:Uma2 family endonuclease